MTKSNIFFLTTSKDSLEHKGDRREIYVSKTLLPFSFGIESEERVWVGTI